MPEAVSRFLDARDRLLDRLDQQLTQAANTREAAWLLCEFTGRELNLADCVIYLPEADGSLLQTAAWGPKRAAANLLESRLRLRAGQGVVGDCARRLRMQRVDDTRADRRYVPDDQPNLSELAVPIHHEELLLAVLDSEHPQAGFYDERYERAFDAIADRSAAHLWRLRESVART